MSGAALKSLMEEEEEEEEVQREMSGQISRLPELSPVREEESDEHATSPSQTTPLPLPASDSIRRQEKSFDDLTEALEKSGVDKESLAALLSNFRGELMAALEEVRSITTHDDNLERQYRETMAENTQLHAAMDKARREIRHLKGQLSVLQMTSSEIREERARKQQKEKKRMEHERAIQTQKHKPFPVGELPPVLTAAERARTVNARGDYIDYADPKTHTHSSIPPPLPPSSGPKAEPLPPPLIGCSCSQCNAKQSLGALTLKPSNELTKSGQQLLLGDRVISKGERIGTVCYIGKLDGDPLGHVYVGIRLDLPVGTCDGSLRSRRYFQCAANHAVFVRPSSITCVTGRKPRSGGTAIPRVREKLPTGLQFRHTPAKSTKIPPDGPSTDLTQPPSPPSHRSTPTVTQAQRRVEAELAALKERSIDELVEPSVLQMSQRIQTLAEKTHRQARERRPDQQPATPPSRPPATPPSHPHTPAHGSAPPPPSPPLRTSTPLETRLLLCLQGKDLGGTGFVTARELTSALTQLDPRQLGSDQQISVGQVEGLLAVLGLGDAEGVGLPYQQIIPALAQAIST